MLLFHESGIGYTTEWNWVDNTKYPIISFGKLVFLNKFHISKGGVELKENVDYIRVLRSKEMEMKFGLELFGGVVLLSSNTTTLDIYAIESTSLDESLPQDTIDPYSVKMYTDSNPMAGSYQDVINIIDEIEVLMDDFSGVTLPQYIKAKLGTFAPRLNSNFGITINHHPSDMIGYGDTILKESEYSARADFMSIDSIPLDSYKFEYGLVPKPTYITGPRVNLVPLNSIPLGLEITNELVSGD